MRYSKASIDTNVPRLFGSWTRTRFLLYLVGAAPSSIAQVSRDLEVDKGHVLGISRHFEKIGAIRIDRTHARGHKISLNSEFPVYDELKALLSRFAKPTGIACRLPRQKRSDVSDPLPQSASLALLLGTKTRTLIIAVLSRPGPTTLINLANYVRATHGSIRVAVAYLANERIVRCIQIGSCVHVDLDTRSDGAHELRTLGSALADMLPLAAASKRLNRSRKDIRIDTQLNQLPELLFPFGSPTQAKLLLALARVGQIRTADLADLTGLNQDQVRGIGVSLVRSGLIVCASRRGGRNLERWYSLNSLYPLYTAIVDYALDIFSDKHESRLARRALGRAQGDLIAPAQQCFQLLKGSDRRTDVLLAVYREAGQHVAEIAVRIELPISRTRPHLEHLAALGLITYRAPDDLPRATINRRFRHAVTLCALLEGASALK
jgi:predicted ArsR family transcriptional regulator